MKQRQRKTEKNDLELTELSPEEITIEEEEDSELVHRQSSRNTTRVNEEEDSKLIKEV